MISQQYVLLGASNLTYAFPMIARSLCQSTAAPIEILAAHGHGRSYGMTSRVLYRTLPGILRCGLWSRFQESSVPMISAIVTDIGNDLLYGARPATILQWVDNCLQRLTAKRADVIISRLPLESVFRMSSARYHATRLCFYPGRGPSWPDMQCMLRDLDDGLRELGVNYGARTICPERAWYGVDPIHIRRRHRPQAWTSILHQWTGACPPAITPTSLGNQIRLWRLRPEYRSLAGIVQRTAQPAYTHHNGSSVYLY